MSNRIHFSIKYINLLLLTLKNIIQYLPFVFFFTWAILENLFKSCATFTEVSDQTHLVRSPKILLNHNINTQHFILNRSSYRGFPILMSILMGKSLRNTLYTYHISDTNKWSLTDKNYFW